MSRASSPKKLACEAEHRPFVLLAITLDPFPQNGRGQTQAQILLHAGFQAGEDLLGFLGRFGRRRAGVHSGQDRLLTANLLAKLARSRAVRNRIAKLPQFVRQ